MEKNIIDITTDRLHLRPFSYDDLEDFFEYAKVDGVGECAGWKHHENIEESRAILEKFVGNSNEIAICEKDSGKVIGSIGFHTPQHIPFGKENLSCSEIGYCLSKDYWGRGYMTEAVKAVIDYALKTLNLDMLICAHFDFNDRSRRVIEKCGFKFFFHGTRNAEMLGKQYLCKDYYLINSEKVAKSSN